ncbi:MAG: TIGR04283 family arsenosugar biosynthesis glycosyltransferase [Acidobacteriota bacterium]|nr:TIGR04283 family arsenosugar biosynthesis glycosyltransferase [Acidobacteriota bacterium]
MRENTPADAAGTPSSGVISVVIPTLDSAKSVGAAIRSAPPGADVVVVDGGSRDGTADAAARAGARVEIAPPGRAVQMNAGAHAARGDILVFLHADCRLPAEAGEQIRRVLARPGVAGGWFPQRINAAGVLFRLGARGSNRRARLLGLPYGDQAIFTRREAFIDAGGFPDDPIMEDAGLARRLRRLGRLEPAESAVITGTEHWRRLGPLLTALLDYLTLGAWLAGVPPKWIAKVYFPLQQSVRERR